MDKGKTAGVRLSAGSCLALAALVGGCGGGGGSDEPGSSPLARVSMPPVGAQAIAQVIADRQPAIDTYAALALAQVVRSAAANTPEGSALQAPVPFSFELPETATTSAGVYDVEGRLLRTLWRGERLPAGRQNPQWDGADDQGQPLPPGRYEVRVVHHQVTYHWEGVIGNSSLEFGGSRLHKAFLPPSSLAAIDDRLLYAVGYNEAQSGLHGLRLAEPRINIRPAKITDPFAAVALVAADARRVYWANTGGLSKTSFVAAIDGASGAPLPFAEGRDICLNRRPDGQNCYPDQDYKRVIGIETDAAWAPTGLAVQRNGRLLAVAHGGQNLIRFYDKSSGLLLRTLGVALQAEATNQIAFSPAGDLWVISGSRVLRYSQVDSANPVVAAQIGGLHKPLAVTVGHSEDAVWVADGGTRQQVRRTNRQGQTLASVGRMGGNQRDSLAAVNRLCFSGAAGVERTGLAVAADQSLWIIDTCNNRLVRLQANGRIDAPVAYLPAVYSSTVDLTDPRRVFANFLEFEVDTELPLAPGGVSWVLRRNWLPSLPSALKDSQAHNLGFGGLITVVTLRNGRTYGMLAANNRHHLVELPASGPMRLLQTLPAPAEGVSVPVLFDNGDLRWAVTDGNGQQVLRRRLEGFDEAGQPRWAATPELLAAVPLMAGTPYFRGAFSGVLGPRFPVSESGQVLFFDQSVQGNEGFHLGATRADGRGWACQASPSAALDGKGSFQTRSADAHIHYGGNALWAHGRHVLYGYHGEFYTDAQTRRVGQANQFMHFFDNGLFIGQFGVPSTRDAPEAAPGLHGNAISPTLVRAGGNLFMHHNDESVHGGVHRWRIEGWDSVRELRVAVDKAASAATR